MVIMKWILIQDLSDDLTAVESRWLSDRAKSQASTGPRTPDIEAMDMETYAKSITAMNDSLYDIQSDIQVLIPPSKVFLNY